MSSTETVIKYDREQTRALYQKATRLGSAVFKNKNSFISDVDVVWFGGQNDNFPFAVDEELNLCAQMPHQQVLDKFRSAIFQKPPATSGICTVKVRSTLCGYVVLRRVNDSNNNVLKTVELLFERKWVGVVHTSDGAKLYLLPTSSLTHHLGITSPDYVYPRILHGLFVRRERKVKQSITSGSTSSSFVATPLPLHQSQTSLAGLSGDNKAAQAPPTSATIATAKSTPKKRKVVSFADLPSSDVDDAGKDKDDVIIMSQDLATVPSPDPVLSASTGSDSKGETNQKQVDTPQPQVTIPQVTIPQVTITPATLTPPKKSVAAASKDGGDATAPQEMEKTANDDRSYLPSPLREILSDEESIASSASSFTSDSSSLLERPTRRRRGGRRRGGGRGKKVALVQDQRTQEEADLAGGESPKTSRRGGRGRGRRRGGRGGRSAPELTRSFSVEMVEVSLKAEG